MTAKELGMITALNTSRNEVLFNTLDRRPLKKEGPRPPSPACRTVAEREEAEKKLSREARAKRRGSGRRNGDQSSDQENTDDTPSLADLLPPLKHVRGAGDKEDYETPARPRKRGRNSGVANGSGDDPSPTAGPKRKKGRSTVSKAVEAVVDDRFVRWNKSLVVIERLELSEPQHRLGGQDISGVKSCLKNKTLVRRSSATSCPY